MSYQVISTSLLWNTLLNKFIWSTAVFVNDSDKLTQYIFKD